MDPFRALSSPTRRHLLKLLIGKQLHASEIARQLGISAPALIKHLKILERSGLICCRKLGNLKLIALNPEALESLLDQFSSEFKLSLPKGASVLDALKHTSGIELRRFKDKEYLASIDGEAGYYIYEVDGAIPNLPMQDLVLTKSCMIKLKKLIPVEKRRILVEIKE